jgi:RNA 3'-terminal phosphate cyclase (ATP)
MKCDVLIDGSQGEGGGQVLRTSLALSLLTGKSFQMIRIRARRKNPGLAPQHLQSIQAAAAISNSAVEGTIVRSQEITFAPGPVTRGEYFFDIGTAGSTSLVFQTICFPLAIRAPGSKVRIRGGTHLTHSPTFHYLAKQWLPWMKRLGYEFQLDMYRAGYYPKGGGEIFAECGVHHHAPSLDVRRRSTVAEIECLATYSNTPRHVAERQLKAAQGRVAQEELTVAGSIEELPAFGDGTHLMVYANYEEGSCAYTGLGERGVAAEQMGREAAEQFLQFHFGRGAIDQYLADQILIPAVLNKDPVRYTTNEVTQHLLTNRDVIQKFLDCKIDITGSEGSAGEIVVS